MPINRPYVLSIAGFDPSAGAGILADIKTFEQHRVYGLGICTAITYQHESEFKGLHWVDLMQLKEQIDILLKKYRFNLVKIGLVKDIDILHHIVDYLKLKIKNVRIVWDPILESSSGFGFHHSIDPHILEHTCKKIYLITPNLEESVKLTGKDDPYLAASLLSTYCAVLLKGGHSISEECNDVLYLEGKRSSFQSIRQKNLDKHGSGCVLSASIISHLAKGKSLADACYEAKGYINNFLKSNNGLLGYHH